MRESILPNVAITPGLKERIRAVTAPAIKKNNIKKARHTYKERMIIQDFREKPAYYIKREKMYALVILDKEDSENRMKDDRENRLHRRLRSETY